MGVIVMPSHAYVSHEDIAIHFARQMYVEGKLDIDQFEAEVGKILADESYAVQWMMGGLTPFDRPSLDVIEK